MTNIPQKQEESKVKLDILNFVINENTIVKPLEPTVYIGGSVFGALGELSFISGKAKAGKTSVASVILASCLTETPNFDSLGIEGVFCEDKAIIYLDTEQSMISSKNIINRVLRLTQLEKAPKNLFIANIRTPKREDKKNLVEQAFSSFGEPYMVFVDGLADLVASPNDEKESNDIIQFFVCLAEKHNCSIVLFLHETPSGDKMRGHLGSEAERKCYATISLSKKSDVHTITSKLVRDGANFPHIEFNFDKDSKGMKTLDTSTTPKREIGIEDFFDLRKLIEEGEKVNNTELCKRIEKYLGVGKSTALSKIKKMVDYKAIEKEEISNNRFMYFWKDFITSTSN